MSNEFHHVSVLLEECIEGLAIKPDGIYVDGTLGGAGHSSRIAAELTTGRHIGIDRDPVALKAAGKRLEPWADRVTLVHSNFCEIKSVLDNLNIEGVDGILLDLGVSSPQLDDGDRGFSYMVDAPLDMRMNNEDSLSADTVVNIWSYEELKNLDLNFIGNMEARELLNSFTDIVVCDGFTGNILLKSAEGIAMSMLGLLKETFMSSTKGKIGAMLLKDDLKSLKNMMDYAEYGGAPLLGVNGGVIKAHGSSDGRAIKNAINQAIKFSQGNVVKDIEYFIKEIENNNNEEEK